MDTQHTQVDMSFLSDGEVFEKAIKRMNQTFKLDCNDKPTDLGNHRLLQFEHILSHELSETNDVLNTKDELQRLVRLADLLGDLTVYIFSEAQRWGLPMFPILMAIMESQQTKLVDGKPLMSEDGSKFIKGPNFVPPEKDIEELILSMRPDLKPQ